MTTAVCPGCVTAPTADAAATASDTPTHTLVLPGIHCAGCIRTVENVLNKQPGIRAARVNLTLKRASVTAAPDTDATPWIEALSSAGFEAHEATDQETGPAKDTDLIMRLGVAGFAMMNVMLLSVAVWSGASDATRDMFHWISAAIALPAAVFAAQPFFANATDALRARRLNMDVPISLAIVLACGMSLYEVAWGGEHAYFDAALSLTFFLLAGRVLDQRMRKSVRSAAADLAALEPSRTIRIENGMRISRPVSDILVGDKLWLTAGSRLPVDARLLDGTAHVDRSFLTGESDAVAVFEGADLHAGEILLTGPVELEATAVGEDTTLRRMTNLVATAENAKSRYTSLADRAAAIYTPAVHLIAFGAFVGWMVISGDVRTALNVAVATLIITCPCALGLAVPAVATAATGRLYRRGLLVKSETALERLADVDTVVFDKTGTLTRNEVHVPAHLSDHARGILRSLAVASDHPLAKAVAKELDGVSAVPLSKVTEHAGLGVSAVVDRIEARFGQGSRAGVDSENGFAFGNETAALEYKEALLPNAGETVRALKSLGLDVHVLTGDTEAKTERIARDLDPESVLARMTPEAKQEFIFELQARARKVLMVGDGLNDTGALTAADASIAPGSALEASRNAADVILLTGDLLGIVEAVRTGRAARRRILENFGLAASYNAVAVPIALAGFATPLAAALAMSASSITVVLNAMRVR